MKNIVIYVLCAIFSVPAIAQLDDRPYHFKRNSISVGAGSHYLETNIEYRSSLDQQILLPTYYSANFERIINKHWTAGLNLRYASYSKYVYDFSYSEQAVLVNYIPFGVEKPLQLRLTGGVVRSKKTESYASFESLYIPADEILSGLYMGIGSSFRITRALFIGVKGNAQLKTDGILERGYTFYVGFAF